MSLKTYKTIKAGIVSLFSLAIGLYSIAQGADPTAVGLSTIAALLVINGFELSEWVAAKQQLVDLQAAREEQERSDSNSGGER
jgi:hypothetical protein